MADEDKDSKTEEPTSKKIEKAREGGDLLQSQEVKTAGQLLASGIIIWMLAPIVAGKVSGYLRGFLEHPHAIAVGTERDFMGLLVEAALQVGMYVSLILLLLLIFALVVGFSQTKLAFTLEKLTFDLNRLDPISGFQRIFSIHSLVDLIKNVAKLSVVAILCYMVLFPRVKELEHLPSMEIGQILEFLRAIMVKLIMFVVALVAVIAAADWLFQRHSYIKKLRMTKQEVKDENKQSEGDPIIKSRLRAIRMARARQRMMAAVPTADVVVTNPTHFACALKYDSETMNAPVLVAKGMDFLAKRIREKADENEIPIVENPPLARALYASVDLDREIPPEHYKTVAEVISYVMRLKEKKRRY